jgi:hypothetical protein
MFDNVYSGRNALLDSEREQLAAYLDSFADEASTVAEGAAR